MQKGIWKVQSYSRWNAWKSQTQIAGLGEIDAIQQLYVAHTQAAIDAE